ncbi:MAG TPA: toll/interleukin-1 receptor domain-containing protein [Nitrospira sp.]|nr:toll/interleukin-1 receptor domain-containing protein [Nitrospira sp.]
MPTIQTIRRAFVSYATEDRRFAVTLSSDLRKSGIEVWVDFEGLVPGTPDWEAELRQAIDESFALLLIASPDSRQSPFVRSELLLAEAKGLPVYALWARGESWIDCIPMRLAHLQYQDFRGAAYSDSFARLSTELARYGNSLPNHFVYQAYYTKIVRGEQKPRVSQWHGSTIGTSSLHVLFAKRPIEGFAELQLEHPFRALHEASSADTIFVRPRAFKSAAHLLDEIFVAYLSKRYPPFTYGQTWHLRQETHGAETIAIDWRSACGLADARNPSALSGAPERYGLIPGSVWKVVDGTPPYWVILGAHDEWLLNTILNEPKAVHRLIAECMTEVSPNEFDGGDGLRIVIATEFMFDLPRNSIRNRIFVQSRECTDEIKRRWTY